MLRARQSSHVENNDDVGQIDQEDSVGYAECIDVEKDDYDQIPADRDTINHDYLVLTSIVKREIKQTNYVGHHQNIQPDIEVHQTKQSVLRPIFLIMLCIIITASVTAVATFFITKHVLSDKNDNMSCSHESCDNGGDCVNGACLCNDGFAGSNCEIDINQTCKNDANLLIPHPNICQMYYNCSQAVSPLPTENINLHFHGLRPAYLHECPYPDLFSTNMSCQKYTDVKCGSRYETKKLL
ncbi:unnamed protein product [Mytilus edulis]|uniref:EGF-like domain-containing protein n=1 Tax=Mytilus edulis TaxID=6550 RepID=A0A8S3T802_MYTED|nr:unnamed protein product [Mytilus edulis]